METVTEKVIEADETIPELPLKDIIFRIYRDIRFSKDPTPYKVRLAWPCPIVPPLTPSSLTTLSHGRALDEKALMPATMSTASREAVSSAAVSGTRTRTPWRSSGPTSMRDHTGCAAFS